MILVLLLFTILTGYQLFGAETPAANPTAWSQIKLGTYSQIFPMILAFCSTEARGCRSYMAFASKYFYSKRNFDEIGIYDQFYCKNIFHCCRYTYYQNLPVKYS